jgi:flagellar biogenesis protein FliO
VINAVPTDNYDPYYTDDHIDDQEYPSIDQGRVMEPDGRMMIMIILLLSWTMKRIIRIWQRRRIPGEEKMWKIITTMLLIQTLSL